MNSPERKPSLTAVGVAVLRAMHQLHDGSPKILDDPVILQLLDQATLDKINRDLSWQQDALTTALRSQDMESLPWQKAPGQGGVRQAAIAKPKH